MRRTDPDNTNQRFFRSSERVFMLNGQWFFAAREGDIGPFRSREHALQEAARFVQERQDLAHFQAVREQERRLEQECRSPRLAIVPKEDEVSWTTTRQRKLRVL